MATWIWTAPTTLDALKVALDARFVGTSVHVFTASMADDTPEEALVFWGADGTEEWAKLGMHRREDRYEIEGAIWINKPGEGEATAKAARDRANEILKQLGEVLVTDSTLAGVIMEGEIGNITLEQGTNTAGRWTQISFRIRVRTRT